MVEALPDRAAGIPLDLAPMEARQVERLPDGADWQFEPKWDGFRCLVHRHGAEVRLVSKSGKPLDRYFPEVVENISALPIKDLVLDGELVIPVGRTLSFEALQMRLHPAQSRVARLARETPARLIVFDCLMRRVASSLLSAPFWQRRKALEHVFRSITSSALLPTEVTSERELAQRWLDARNEQWDGVIAKRLDLPYMTGQRAMLKVKRLRTADCVVGGFRYDTDGRHVGSLLLGLYDGSGLLHHVGYTSAISAREKPDLTRRLEKLASPPGFTGDAPGGPSRWSTARSAEWQPLAPRLVVEVRYDHVTGRRFRHGTRLIRWRPDKPPQQCTLDQIAQGHD